MGGEAPPAKALIPNTPGEVEADGVRATVSAAPLKVGEPARVSFQVWNEEGGPARLEPYMGALGHLMFISAVGQYVHVHPAAGEAYKGLVEFETYFPEPGLYKGWGQFKLGGRVRVVSFALKVE